MSLNSDYLNLLYFVDNLLVWVDNEKGDLKTLEEKGNEVVKSVKEISDGDMEDLEDDESDTEEEKSDEEIIDGQMKDFGRRWKG